MDQLAKRTITGLLSLFLFIVLAQSQESVNQMDTIDFQPGLSEINSGHIQTLPFRTSGDLILSGPNSYYLKGGKYYSDGLEMGNGSVFIDGMQVKDGNNFLFRAIDKYGHYRSNQPIQFGNVAGSMSVIQTRSFKDSLYVEADILTSLDKGYENLVYELLIGGPVRFRKREKRSWKKAPSFMVSSEVNSTNDPDPSWENKHITKPDFLNFLTGTPLGLSGLTGGGTFYNSEFSLPDDFNKVTIHQNAGRKTRNVFAKVEIPVSDKMELTAGTYFKYDHGNEFIFENALFNSHNNPVTTVRNFDNYLNWKHEIINESDLKISYNIHFQYSNYYFNRQSERHEDRWFEYGYLGKFQTYKMQSYELGSIEIDGEYYDNVWMLNSWDRDTAYTFQNLGYNPEVARYTEMIYELFPDKGDLNAPLGNWRNQDDLTSRGGLLNGQQPEKVYGLWNNIGTTSQQNFLNNPYMGNNAFGESNYENYRGQFLFHVAYKKHHFKFGFEYDKKVEKSYVINPNRLWQTMRGQLNNHIVELDLANPFFYMDTVTFYRMYSETLQWDFDYNLRKKLGLPVDGLDFILIDSYDMKNNTIDYYDKDGKMHTIKTPTNLLELDMFDPMGLIQNGIVKYKGYSFDGKKMKSSNNTYSFFSNWQSNAFSPVYSSVFIEDDFQYKNFTARVGLRMDYYNANQPVLIDEYCMYETYKVGDVNEISGMEVNHPSNIEDNYVVYVDNAYSPTKVMGYRNESTWFNRDGVEISDPYLLDAGSGISPYLKYPEINIADDNWRPGMSFTDYKPAYTFLPQVNLNYKFWKMNVYAGLNSFSKNPYYMHAFWPENYLLLNQTYFFENPGLKPYRVYKFNLGSNVNVYKNLFVDLSYQFMSITDYFAIIRIIGAYPREYITIVNRDKQIDVNSMTASIFVLPPNTTGLNANISATFSTRDEVVRTVLNISDFVLNSNVGYNFGYGQDFTFPESLLMKTLFEGFNIGLFYQTRSGTYLPLTTYGNQNYHYSPDFSVFNLRVEKGFYIKAAGVYLSAYLWVENLFNRKNVYYIDPVTGAVNDDGYLSAPEWQQEINEQTNPDSYRLLYAMKLNNPAYYAKPRIFRAGVILKF